MAYYTKELVAELNRIRRANGWNFRESAEKCGVAESTMSRVLRGSSTGERMHISTADKLAEGFGISSQRMEDLTNPAEPYEPETPAPTLTTLLTIWRSLDAEGKAVLVELGAELVAES